VKTGGKNVQKQNTHFGWRQIKIGPNEGHGILFFPFRKTVRSPGKVKDSERKEEKKAVRTLYFPPPPHPVFGLVIKVFFNLLDDLIKCFLFKREIFLLGY
jgi:hypothetical protein